MSADPSVRQSTPEIDGGTPLDTPPDELERIIADYDRSARDPRERPHHRAHSAKVAATLRKRLREMTHAS